ncbi:MAG TPA: hypothetical protein PLQ19_08660 [Aeromicrobium sp.]|nr:hypothetical protein [Aeromicrobium sp.]
MALGLSACSDDSAEARPGLSGPTATGSVSGAESLTGANVLSSRDDVRLDSEVYLNAADGTVVKIEKD